MLESHAVIQRRVRRGADRRACGTTRISEDHELARRFPHRFTPVKMREEARVRFRARLDRADTYAGYVRMLDAATARLEAVQRGGVARCGGQSTTDLLYPR
jgi:hypothetical protein